ncbi:DNA repair protein RAD5A-like [Zingiber officinale]|uniref:DNA repair protein RAD5A-like n=1 Tax=Zingiber officinale TaxID=94328 RepID=UPI001C4B2387|nr:DNA repair protein RAD5A-like [Zingiber officinale]
MGINKVTDEGIALVRSVVGQEFSEMDIIRALHMANNDVSSAINIIFDTPHLRLTPGDKTIGAGRRSLDSPTSITIPVGRETIATAANVNLEPAAASATPACTPLTVDATSLANHEPVVAPCKVESDLLEDGSPKVGAASDPYPSTDLKERDWWLVGSAELSGLSTCKGRRIKPGDKVIFTFPLTNKVVSPSSGTRFPSRGRSVASCSEIVRFSTEEHGEVGRIPNEWARCLLPLVKANKIRIEGFCKSSPEVLSIMDTIHLSVSVHINNLMIRKHHQMSLRSTNVAMEDLPVQPLPTLFRFLGLIPFKKAEFTPEDLYTRKRPMESKDRSETDLPLENLRKLCANRSKIEDDKDHISDNDMDCIIGISDHSKLEEMTPPDSLQCELRPYQKQALHWMLQIEKGRYKEAATTLHPCWHAFRVADKRAVAIYLNAFSGDVTLEFPSTLQMSRGGILADAMGLGKTIMTIALLLAHYGKGGSCSSTRSQESLDANEVNNIHEQSQNATSKLSTIAGFRKLFQSKASLVGAGNLIVCPMTLLSQWKAEFETHTKPGSLNVYVHYGQNRTKDTKVLAQNDVVLTTYGVLASEFSTESTEENGVLYFLNWFRVVLDEAHIIKSSKSQVSMAAASLTADRRWCLTGTPIQNNLEDLYSLLRFLRVEPWGNWGLWNKLIQKPYEEGDERGLKLVQSILRSIMLRRTKSSTDAEGRPILDLPPAQVDVLYCELSEAEKDFYEALYRKSKVKFDQFVEQGRVLHNYASILELLLRLRQCCDHPFLVMSRGDTQEFSDLNKLAKHFLKGGKGSIGGDPSAAPSKAYIKEVVDELQKGEERECPICLEAYEDAVLTSCAHRLCRECLLASWRSAMSGLCPVCRKLVNKQDLITAPTDSRFQIDIEKNWVESSKVSVLLRELENLRDFGAKSIVFSQWTGFLDLLEIPLSRHNFSFVRLDGTLNQQQRERVLCQFAEDNNILILLMSLKAGGVGINLTAATSAFLMDPWWNPAVEEQAVMRIHRIGQTKSVAIKRFIVKGTVEERMQIVQARKQRMISGALTDHEVRAARIEELKMLFT